MQEADDPVTDLEMQLQPTPQARNNDGGLGAKQMIHTAILVIRFVQRFFEGISHGSPHVSRVSSSISIDSSSFQEEQEARQEDTEEVAIEVDADKTALLLRQIRKLTNVIRCSLAFKSHAASVASAHAHRYNSDATDQRILELAEASEASHSLAAASEHPITIYQSDKRSQIKNISKIVRKRDLGSLQKFGGLGGVIDALGTDLGKGVSDEEALHRQQEFLAPTRTLLHFLWEEVKSKIVLLLLLAAALSIIFEILVEGDVEDGWTSGVVVLTAAVLQVLFASVHKYWNEQRAQKKLQKQQQREERRVKEFRVKRGGETKDICESEIVYGDILLLKKGCQVPAEGLFVDGDQDLELNHGSESYITNEQKPFLSYGERVIKGDARMVVTSTIMMMREATSDENKRFKVETHLDKLNIRMHYIRIIASILIIIVLIFRHIAGAIDDENVYRPESMGQPSGIRSILNTFLQIIKESKYTTKALTKLLCVSLVGLTEGVPFAVSLALVYWNNKTLSSNGTEQDSHGVLKMATVTKICTDAFGEFTEDDMEVQKLFIGGELICEDKTPSPNVVEALCDGIGTSKENGNLHLTNNKLGLNVERMKQQRPRMEESEDRVLHLNGPVDEIMSKCTHYYNILGDQVAMNDTVRRDFRQANDEMECIHQLTTIAVACKHTDTQPQDADDWVLVALLGLKQKNKEATKAEVKACKKCGIGIIIISDKKLSVLKDIALQYGLTTVDDSQSLMLTGEDFRKYSDKERLENANKICVLGEAFASDKLLLVEALRENGGVVAFLGQRTDETPALIEADIGIAMGGWSSQEAIESSDIIIWDGSFSIIISMVDSGKCLYHNIQSYLKLVLIVTISRSLVSLIQTAVWGDDSLTILQSVWADSVVIIFGALGSLTKASADKPVSLCPISCGRSLTSAQMIRNILLQVFYQVTCLVIIQATGSKVVGSSQHMKAMVFNIFVICQVFNLFSARELQKMNFFRCIHLHKMFWIAITAIVVLHGIFVTLQANLGYGTSLSWKLWAVCVLVALPSWLVDWLGKCISQFIIKKLVNTFRHT